MARPRNEEQRQRIVTALQEGKSWRTIQKTEGVSSTVVQDVAREAGLLKKRSPPSAPSAPETPPKAPQQEGNGLDEFIPEREEKRPKQAPKQSAPTGEKGACPHCRVQWELEAGEKAPSSCPRCRKLLDVQAAAADEIYQCGRCHAQWQLDVDEDQVKACPKCGVRF